MIYFSSSAASARLYIVLYLLLLFVFPDAKLTFQALFWLFSVQDQ